MSVSKNRINFVEIVSKPRYTVWTHHMTWQLGSARQKHVWLKNLTSWVAESKVTSTDHNPGWEGDRSVYLITRVHRERRKAGRFQCNRAISTNCRTQVLQNLEHKTSSQLRSLGKCRDLDKATSYRYQSRAVNAGFEGGKTHNPESHSRFPRKKCAACIQDVSLDKHGLAKFSWFLQDACQTYILKCTTSRLPVAFPWETVTVSTYIFKMYEQQCEMPPITQNKR